LDSNKDITTKVQSEYLTGNPSVFRLPDKSISSNGNIYTPLSKEIVGRAKNKEKMFRANAFDPRLNTHKLHGEEKNAWAFWVNYTYRIKFIFLGDDEVLFYDS